MIAVTARCDACGRIAAVPHAGPATCPADTPPPVGWLATWRRILKHAPETEEPVIRLVACSVPCAAKLVEDT